MPKVFGLRGHLSVFRRKITCSHSLLEDTSMKAIGFYQNHPISHPQALQDIELPTPELRDHDLLVEVKAVSVNPVDTKIRRGGDIPEGGVRIAGWDAAGIVRATGPLATHFKP